MKAIVIYKAGGIEQLVYREVSKPKVKQGWSLIKIKGFGINHSEIFTREGKSPTVQFPRVLGIECVGEIEETSDPTRLAVGQKVISMMGEMGRAFDGSYAEYVLVPNKQIYPVETSISWRALATIPETYFTAFGSMKKLQLKETDRVLVRGATSGVGLAFLKLLKAQFKDIYIDGTSRKLAKKNQLIKAGFSGVVEDRNGQLRTNRKYHKILELVGPVTIKNSLDFIEPNGILCSTGQLGGRWFLEDFDPIVDLKDAHLTGFYSGIVDENKINELLRFVEKNRVNVEPERVFRLEEIQQAHKYLESSRSFGKVIILNEEKK